MKPKLKIYTPYYIKAVSFIFSPKFFNTFTHFHFCKYFGQNILHKLNLYNPFNPVLTFELTCTPLYLCIKVGNISFYAFKIIFDNSSFIFTISLLNVSITFWGYSLIILLISIAFLFFNNTPSNVSK